MADHKPNYGDIALDLSPDWSRMGSGTNQAYLLTTVGHEMGVADVYLRDKPGERHQFYWANPQDQADMSVHRSRHYAVCTKTEWEKNPNLWDWNGEGQIIYNGQILMAREESWFQKDKEDAEREHQEREERNRNHGMDAEQEKAERQWQARNPSSIITDERGRPLTPLSQKRK